MKRHPVGVEVAVKAMGYSFNSSTGKLALAAMRSFELFENVQGGTNATVKLTTLALDIASDYVRESAKWWEAVKQVALAPNVHRQLWDKYGPNLPADDELRRYLVRELKFNDNAVGPFIQEYKNTIEFAKLSEPDIIDEDNGESSDHDDNSPPPSPKSRLDRNRRVTTGLKEDVFSLDEGSVILQWPERLSKTSAQDLEDWLALIGRKIKRAADAPPVDHPLDDADADE
jgi:hypothetical protein